MRSNQNLAAPVFVAIIIAFGLSACTQPAENSAIERSVSGPIVVTVNETPIFLSDVELEAAAQGKIEPGQTFDSAHPAFQPILDQLIDQRLLAQEAVARGLDTSDVARRRLEAGRERILGNILVENLVAEEVTEEAIDEMYAAQVELQQIDDQVRLRHILLTSEEDAIAMAQQVQAGEPFAELALQNSNDPRTRLEGGSFGWVSPNDFEDPFPAVIGDTPTGEVSDPFETSEGWHILKVDDRRTQPPKTKDEMRPEIITFLTFTQISDILRDLRQRADISQSSIQSVPEDQSE